MQNIYSIILLLIVLVSCNSQPLDDFHEEGNGLVRSITETLKPIHTREELLKAAPRLKGLFNDLVSVAIEANEYSYYHPESERINLSPEDHYLSDALREELNRVCHIEGGREIVEKCQEESLHRLDAFLSKSKKS